MRTNLIALALCAGSASANPGVPDVIDISDQHVLGVSGIEVTGNGSGFVAVSDAGWFLGGVLERTDGQLTGGRVTSVQPIIGQNGFPVRARRVGDWSDAEGLDLSPDGTLYVSFERWARVSRYTSTEASGQWIKDHADFRTWDDNRQLEAVAMDTGGFVYTLPENATAGGFPLYRLDPEGWTKVADVPASNSYSVVGADFGPDGLLYLLERKFVFATWWQSRVRTFNLADGSVADIWEPEIDAHGNLEGISVWVAADGMRATMVSDNNGTDGVPTEIVEIRLTD